MVAHGSTDRSKGAVGNRGAGLVGTLRNFTHLPRDVAFARLGYDLKRPVFALPIYRYSLTGVTATALEVAVTDPWPGNADLGAAIVQKAFTFNGRRVIDPAPLWAPVGVEPGWLAELHGFAWLRDLRAAGGDAARRGARELVGAWLDAHDTWNALAWEPLATGRRLANWLGCYEFFAASAAIEYRHRLLTSIAQQAQHLHRVLPAGLAGADLIAAVKGLIAAGVCLPGGEAWRARGLALLRRELPRQILADGGHGERNPSRHLAVLRDLIDLRAMLHKAEAHAGRAHGDETRGDETRGDETRGGETRGDETRGGETRGGETRGGQGGVPAELHGAIEGMAPALRMFQHGDGGLALFNGASEEEGWQVDMVLQRAGGRRRPLTSAPDSGFQRMRAGRTVVLVDAGAAPRAGLDGHAHAGTLSFEMSVGRERLIVNCGARRGDPAWHRAQRASAAHSTLVVDDTNSSELLAKGGFGRRAQATQCHREEADGNVWLEVSHDGYRHPFGMIHHRRLYLATDGADLRGEDRLEAGGAHARGGPFALRFHLHPDVRASLKQGGDAVLLRLPKGGGWQLRGAGAEARLEQSVYLGHGGEIRRSQQVVLSGHAAPDGTTVKWALRRIDRKRV